jgi:hypothetical protein
MTITITITIFNFTLQIKSIGFSYSNNIFFQFNNINNNEYNNVYNINNNIKLAGPKFL